MGDTFAPTDTSMETLLHAALCKHRRLERLLETAKKALGFYACATQLDIDEDMGEMAHRTLIEITRMER